ncbi:ester cyclase [Protaetiibacter intestinalis]|uniref:Ester cyclase n=1 Tax=Protaetiibacter intestinalis TaxID=2419774 RepID=A0A387B482_9MICO|nr:ester cyclase [Protaetiibacter intestinalis]AYF97223.1 ester cyclase [Protaetiibacter intestinalis]
MGDRDLLSDRSDLVVPESIQVDAGLAPERARHMVLVTQLLYTFWHTGDVAYLRQAVAPEFVDNTLPPGRPAGIDGVMVASRSFRAAVPDLTCGLEDVIIAGDKIAVRLRFRGTFSGRSGEVMGRGQAVDFTAFDIQHVGPERIIEDWHLEDNLTFLTQAGLIPRG